MCSTCILKEGGQGRGGEGIAEVGKRRGRLSVPVYWDGLQEGRMEEEGMHFRAVLCSVLIPQIPTRDGDLPFFRVRHGPQSAPL